MTKTYPIPASFLEVQTVVKKSRFIARAHYITDREQAMAVLAEAKQDYSDARHHCWAYLLGNPKSASSAAMNDDGEPSGTAGKPILNVIQHKGVGDVMIVIIRYFGGIKLGAGGLTRAYSGAAEAVMSQLDIKQQIATTHITLHCDFSLEQPLRHWVRLHQSDVVGATYTHQVEITLSVPLEKVATLHAWCAAHQMSWPGGCRKD